MHIWSEIAQSHQRICMRAIDECNTLPGRLVGHEHFILGHLPKANQRRAIDIQFADLSVTLRYDQPVSSRVINRTASARRHCKLLRAELLLLGEPAINDPLVYISPTLRIAHWNRLKIVVILKLGIEVSGKVDKIGEKI